MADKSTEIDSDSRQFKNWFVARMTVEWPIQIGTRFLTGHGRNATVGEYVVTHIEQVDDDTVTMTVKRLKR